LIGAKRRNGVEAIEDQLIPPWMRRNGVVSTRSLSFPELYPGFHTTITLIFCINTLHSFGIRGLGKLFSLVLMSDDGGIESEAECVITKGARDHIDGLVFSNRIIIQSNSSISSS
jgi:hypothetical protein